MVFDGFNGVIETIYRTVETPDCVKFMAISRLGIN